MVSPGVAEVVPGGNVTTTVTVVYPGKFENGSATPLGLPGYFYLEPENVTAVPPIDAGVTATLTFISEAPCTPAQIPPQIAGRDDFLCASFSLVVDALETTTTISPVVVSAQWISNFEEAIGGGNNGRVIEQVGSYDVHLPPEASPPTTDFLVMAGGAGAPKVYATLGFVPVKVLRASGSTDPVTLTFDALGESGVTGTFFPNPVPNGVDSSQLRLELPARLGAGGVLPLRVIGNNGTTQRIIDFNQRVEPLLTLSLSPADAVLSSNAPVDIDVTMSFDPYGPFSVNGPGRIDLAALNPGPGVNARFDPDATPRVTGPATTVRRTLHLSSDGAFGGYGGVTVRATLSNQREDAASKELPFVDAVFVLTLNAGQQWEFVNNGASYFGLRADTVGIALRSDNQPAIAWLEDFGGERKLGVKRFDGTSWTGWPAGGIGGTFQAPSGQIEEAGFALTRADVARVAVTYQGRTALAVATAGSGWTLSSEYLASGDQHLWSPRIAASRGTDQLALAYVAQTDVPAISGLFVKQATGVGAFAALAGPQPDGSLNRDPDGSVLRDSPALAVLADGNPVVAWLEQPASPALPPAAWLRVRAGAAWGPALAVPAGAVPAAAPMQLDVDTSGAVYLSWLEGSPARVKAARLAPGSVTWAALGDASNGDGSLNLVATDPARDISLAIDASGRAVIAWSEGPLTPFVWAKRWNGASWELLGTAVDGGPGHTSTRPRVVSDGNNRLYLAFTHYLSGADLTMTPPPRSDIFVARWRFP
ncbi:MAG: hypothetical protein ABI699_04030 [Caldimonas sp.]